MPAQNAAVLPLPFEPVTTTERRCKPSRSTARASSSSAIRARQTPSPYFGRSNTRAIPSRKKCDARFSGSGRLRPDSSSSRIDGLEFTSITAVASGSPPMSVNRSTAATRSPSARTAFLAAADTAAGRRGLEHHRSSRAQVHPPGNLPALALRQARGRATVSLLGVTAAGESPRACKAALCAARRSRIERTPSPSTNGRIFARRIEHLVVQQEDAVFVARRPAAASGSNRSSAKPRADIESSAASS